LHRIAVGERPTSIDQAPGEFTLRIGDSLRQKIEEGLANSRYGVVIVSKNFFAKNWPQHELDSLATKEVVGTGTKVILPVWHDISLEDVQEKAPMLSGRVAAKSSDGLDTGFGSSVRLWVCEWLFTVRLLCRLESPPNRASVRRPSRVDMGFQVSVLVSVGS